MGIGVGRSKCLGFEQIRMQVRDGSSRVQVAMERDTIEEQTNRPDGEIGRHSGLKIIEVYGFIADKGKINKDLWKLGIALTTDATLTHFS
jgi:hypothetical protein